MSQLPELYVFGAGGHGKAVGEAVLAGGRPLQGYLDDDATRHGQTLMGRPVVGALAAVRGRRAGVEIALAVGANDARLAILERLHAEGYSVATVIHPSAVVASSAVVGAGTFVGPLAIVNAAARVGQACIVNSGAVIEHDNVLGDGVHVSSNATLGGDVRLEYAVHVGLGAVVLPGLTVGARSVVGAGAVVVRDVPADTTVVGVPARALARSR